jgi:glyoxylase-like metal-dependent hydrolase (beta-lactamase superfamily II)
MKVRAEPKPLGRLLPGGSKGATVSVEPLIAGHVNWPLPMMERPGGPFESLKLMRTLVTGKPPLSVPCPAFLIRHSSAGPIVVDTGLHPSVSSDPAENFGKLAARISKPTLEPGTDVPAQLRRRGLDPAAIPVVVMTHLHMDHSSAISEFPQATFVVSEAEWEAATGSQASVRHGYRTSHYDHAFDFRTVDYDGEGIDSYASFGRTFDLFGDGSVRLAYTPGHSSGHQCVIAHLRDRDFVIGGDAVYMYRQFDDGAAMPPRPVDRHNFRRSLQELKLFRKQFPHAIVTPGHDPSFYEQLEERYE